MNGGELFHGRRDRMVNGITTVSALKSLDTTKTDYSKKKDKETEQTTTSAYSETAAEYVSSGSTSLKDIAAASEEDRAALIEKMKADVEARTAQLRDLVEKMFLQQGDATTENQTMWQKLAEGGLVTDEEAVTKAQEDISENGYWGVSQTSDRILSFAVALSGGDQSKMSEMAAAFKTGFEQATRAWGGKLPQLCQDTYDAVLQKFDDWANSSSTQ